MISYDHLTFPSDTDTGLHGGVSGNHDATALFFGYVSGGNRRRQGLGTQAVLAGAAVGNIQWSADSPLPLPETAAANASVNAIAYHPTKDVVYLATGQSPTAATDQVLCYCDVIAGVPGPPVAVASALTGHNINSLAVSPNGLWLYFAGTG